jgi:pyridoxine kinase
MARILAISSQVARGAVGLSAAVPALQALGHDVIALPTILLSNHPGHARFAGERVSPDLIVRMLDALAANGWLDAIDAVLTGYLPSAEHVAVARDAVQRVQATNSRAIFVCDPILGDEPKGLYIAPDAAEAIRDELAPIAQVVKMNRFECEWLAGASITTPGDVGRAAAAHHWRTAIVTSMAASEVDMIANVLIEGRSAPIHIDVARRARVPTGTGDLLGALWLGYRLWQGTTGRMALERAVDGVELVVERSGAADELQLVECLRQLDR